MSTHQQQLLSEIIDSPFSSDADKQDAKKLLDAMNNPAPPAPAAPAPTAPAASELKYLSWIPAVTPQERIAYRALEAKVWAGIQERLAASKAESKVNAPATPQDADKKTQLLATVNDAASSETQIVAAKLALANIEIDEFNEARARRTESQVAA